MASVAGERAPDDAVSGDRVIGQDPDPAIRNQLLRNTIPVIPTDRATSLAQSPAFRGLRALLAARMASRGQPIASKGCRAPRDPLPALAEVGMTGNRIPRSKLDCEWPDPVLGR